MNKLNTFALKMELNAKDKLNKFFRNTEGSETTEKIGMVVGSCGTQGRHA